MPFYAKDKSKIKMYVLTKNGEPNHTIYSPIDQNHKPAKTICEGMLRRFMEKPVFKVAQVIQFYENGNLIEKIHAK